MKFYTRQRRMPQVIIVSLIDVFVILLIFTIVTTTFKQDQPAVTIALPEDVQAESYAYPGQFFEKRVYWIERPAASITSQTSPTSRATPPNAPREAMLRI